MVRGNHTGLHPFVWLFIGGAVGFVSARLALATRATAAGGKQAWHPDGGASHRVRVNADLGRVGSPVGTMPGSVHNADGSRVEEGSAVVSSIPTS